MMWFIWDHLWTLATPVSNTEGLNYEMSMEIETGRHHFALVEPSHGCIKTW